MTDEELNGHLNGWQINVESVTGQVMACLDAAPVHADAAPLAELLSEVRALRGEVAALRREVAAIQNPPSRPTIKGYPLLPFARPEDQAPFLQ